MTAPRLPPMHALAAFEAAARLRTFAKAAEELFVTQSAVSHRIRQLEEHLGVTLFVRIHKQVVLTPEGERFLVEVRDAIQKISSAAEGLAAKAPAKQCRLRVTCAPALASQILIPNLRDYLAQNESVEIEIDTSTRISDLDEDSFDLALRLGIAPWPGYQAHLLVQERVSAYATPEYAARFGQTRNLSDLSRATLISSKPFTWASWLKTPAVVQTAFALSFREVWAAIDAAAHGLGVVLSNQICCLDARRQGLLIPFLDMEADMQRHYYAVHRADSPRSEEILRFVSWLGPVIRAELDSVAKPLARVALRA